MKFETRTELSNNDLLDIELGKIPPTEAIRLLLKDLRTEQQYAAEVQEYAEKLEDKMYIARTHLNAMQTVINTLLNDIGALGRLVTL